MSVLFRDKKSPNANINSIAIEMTVQSALLCEQCKLLQVREVHQFVRKFRDLFFVHCGMTENMAP